MSNWSLHYFPLAPLFFLALVVLLGLVIAFIQIGILQYAYEKIGVNQRYVFAILILSLLGSYINIPIAQLSPQQVLSNQEVVYFGIRYVIPMVENWPGTVIAVNLGGAVIPTVLSSYLIVKHQMYGRALLGVALVTAVVHMLAQPVMGVGIAVPMFIPPLLAAGVALLLARQSAPSLAYITGSLGTLIGADLLNLDKLQTLGAPVASIGGAGTFDGIFLTGILAVLLA
jgi:uncharacterized membrane protein